MKRAVITCVTFCFIVLISSAYGDIYVVNPGGTGDFPTIQAAVDAVSDGDIIELTDGTFTGEGNRNIDFNGKAITVRSQSGNAEGCIMDCEGIPDVTRRGFYFQTGEGEDSVVRDIAILNGFAGEP
jgi:hypothetical protein